jgi:alanyl-tRNA synthetase
VDVVQKLDALLSYQKELEKKLKAFEQKAAAGLAEELAAKAVTRDGLKFVSAAVSISEPEALRSLGSQVLARLGEGVVTLGAAFGEKTSLVAFCSPAAIKAGIRRENSSPAWPDNWAARAAASRTSPWVEARKPQNSPKS